MIFEIIFLTKGTDQYQKQAKKVPYVTVLLCSLKSMNTLENLKTVNFPFSKGLVVWKPEASAHESIE